MVAAGSGTRFGRPKQYESLGDERVIDRSRRVAEAASDGVVVVVPPGDEVRERAIAGGSTRAASVRAGLACVPDDADVICVHDAARPLASAALYRAVIEAVTVDGVDGAIPAVPVADTIKVVDRDGTVVATPDRATLFAVQTPQAFTATALRAAHDSGLEATDDAALVEQRGGRVVVVEGEPTNRKLTHVADLEWARRVMMEPAESRPPEGRASE